MSCEWTCALGRERQSASHEQLWCFRVLWELDMGSRVL